MSNNYADEKTGLSIQIASDGSFDITAPPAQPTMRPTIVFTGGPTEKATTEEQIEAFLAKYAEDEAAKIPAEETAVEKSPTEKSEVEESTEDTAGEATEDEATNQVKRGSLPDDFPYLSFLTAGGVNTYARLRKRIEAGTLTEIDGIGDVRAAEIEEAYNA